MWTPETGKNPGHLLLRFCRSDHWKYGLLFPATTEIPAIQLPDFENVLSFHRVNTEFHQNNSDETKH